MVGAFGTIAKRGLQATGVAAVAGFGAAVTKGFGRLRAIDDARFKLQGLGHDASNVEAIMDSALAAVKGTAFGLGDAATIAAGAVAAGIKPGQDLTRVLSLTGDAAAIAGIGLDEMGSIFGKVAAGNRMMTEEMNQLQDRGLPVLQWLQDEFGVTADAAREMVSSGEVDFAAFTKIIETNIGGAALTAGESFRGSLANVGAAVGRFGAALLKPAFTGAPAMFGRITAGVDRLTEAVGPRVEAAAQRAADAIGGLVALVARGDFTRQFAAAFDVEEDAPIVDLLLRVRENALGARNGIALIAAAFTTGFAGGQAEGFLGLVSDIGGAAATVAQGFSGSWDRITGIFSTLAGAAQTLAPAVADLAGAVAAATAAIGVSVWEIFLSTAEVLATVVADVLAPAIATIATWLAAHQPVVTAIVGAYTAWAVVTKGIAIAQGILNAVMYANPIGLIIAAVAALVIGAVALVKNWDKVAAFFSGMWETVKAAWAAGVAAVVGFVQSLPGRVLGIVGDLVERVVGFVKTLPYRIGFILGRLVRTAVEWFHFLRTEMPLIAARMVVAVLKWVEQLPGKVLGFIADVVPKIRGQVPKWKRAATLLALRAFVAIRDKLRDLPRMVREMISRAIRAIGGMTLRAYNAAREMASGLWDGFKAGLGIRSPSFIEQAMGRIAGNVINQTGSMADQIGRMQRLARTIPDMPEILPAPRLGLGVRGDDGGSLGSRGVIIEQVNISNPAPERVAESLPRMNARLTHLAGL